MNKNFVKCCQAACENNIVYIDWQTMEFKLVGLEKPITYCPWCRILLDLNLPMESEG